MLTLTNANAIPTSVITARASTRSVPINATATPVSNSVPTTIAPVSQFRSNSKQYPVLNLSFLIDVDECRLLLGICRNGRCRNTVGSFSCECADGYTLTDDGQNCRDINECTEVDCLSSAYDEVKLYSVLFFSSLFKGTWNMSSSRQVSEFDGIFRLFMSSRIRVAA